MINCLKERGDGEDNFECFIDKNWRREGERRLKCELRTKGAEPRLNDNDDENGAGKEIGKRRIERYLRDKKGVQKLSACSLGGLDEKRKGKRDNTQLEDTTDGQRNWAEAKERGKMLRTLKNEMKIHKKSEIAKRKNARAHTEEKGAGLNWGKGKRNESKAGRRTSNSRQELLFCFFSRNLHFPSVLSALRCAKQKSHETANKGKLTEGKRRNGGSEEGIELRTKMPRLCTFREKEKDNDEKRGKKRQNSKKKRNWEKGSRGSLRSNQENIWEELTREYGNWEMTESSTFGKVRGKRNWSEGLREHTRRTAMAQTEQIERESGKHVSGTGTLCFVCAAFQPAICLTSLPSIHFPRSLDDLADSQLRDGMEMRRKMMKAEKWTRPKREMKRKWTRTGGNWGRFRIRFGERFLTGKLS